MNVSDENLAEYFGYQILRSKILPLYNNGGPRDPSEILFDTVIIICILVV